MIEVSSSVDEPVRNSISAVLDRAQSDEQFAERLRSNPHEVLTEAGVDSEAAGELSDEISAQSAEVQGHAKCNWTCDRYTCIISLCGNIPFSD